MSYRISNPRQVSNYSVFGMFYFPWHRHQIEGANDRLPKDTGKVGSFTKGNCQSLQAAPVGFEPAIQYNTIRVAYYYVQLDIRRNKASEIVKSQRVVRWLTFRKAIRCLSMNAAGAMYYPRIKAVRYSIASEQ